MISATIAELHDRMVSYVNNIVLSSPYTTKVVAMHAFVITITSSRKEIALCINVQIEEDVHFCSCLIFLVLRCHTKNLILLLRDSLSGR